MTSTAKTLKTRNARAPKRRRSAISGIEYTAEGDLTPTGYRMLDEAGHGRILTNNETDAMFRFEANAAHDLLHYANVRGGGTGSPGFYRLGDVHTAWIRAERDLPNVYVIRDVWNSNSDEHCCLYCLCHDFLLQVLEGILIDNDGGLILYRIPKYRF
jgi:hypothetical protein